MRLIRNAWRWLRSPRVVDTASLDEFVVEAAAQVAHKATVGYCQVKAGINHRALWRDDDFMTSLEQSRWQAFAAVLADFGLIVEGFLRPRAADHADAVRSWLIDLYAARLAPGPLRAGDGDRNVGAALQRAFVDRLNLASLASPRDISTYAPATARQVFEHLPFHREVIKLDYPVIEGMIRFGTVGFWDQLERRVDAAAVVDSITEESAPPAARVSPQS